MHDQDVAVRVSLDGAADAVAQETLEESGFPCADDDEVCPALLGELDDRLSGTSQRKHRLRLYSAIAELFGRLVEQRLVCFRRVGRVAGSARMAISRETLLSALEADPRAAIALIEVLAARFRETA